MVHTDLKFFTNEPERDLYSRFAAILKSNTQFFDVLVGYFRASGFFKMYEALENVEKIRILVGLNVDRYTVKIIDRMNEETKYAAVSTVDGKEVIAEEIEKEFESAASSASVEKGVRVFMEWLKSGKLEMRMYTDAQSTQRFISCVRIRKKFRIPSAVLSRVPVIFQKQV